MVDMRCLPQKSSRGHSGIAGWGCSSGNQRGTNKAALAYIICWPASVQSTSAATACADVLLMMGGAPVGGAAAVEVDLVVAHSARLSPPPAA